MVLEIVLEMVPQIDFKNRLKFISQTIKSSKISPQNGLKNGRKSILNLQMALEIYKTKTDLRRKMV